MVLFELMFVFVESFVRLFEQFDQVLSGEKLGLVKYTYHSSKIPVMSLSLRSL